MKCESNGIKKKNAIQVIQQKREELDRYRRELEEAENRYDLNKAAELRHGKIPTLEKELQVYEEAINGASESRLLREEVTAEEIASIVSRWTGIPVTKLLKVNERNFYV